MDMKEALNILHIVRCDTMGYARDLSYTPTRAEIGQAIEIVTDRLAED